MIGERYDAHRHAPRFSKRSLFLSASTMDPARRDQSRSPAARDEVVLQAVVEVTYEVLRVGWNLVFGGHPAISPMVLSVVRRSEAERKPVICFQSELYEALVPPATKDLWHYGTLLWTKAEPAGAPTKDASLQRMRDAMLSVPNLAGAVFLGGMKGVLDEAELFAAKHKHLPRYALPGTGSAAADLFASDPLGYAGRSPELRRDFAADLPSSVLARRLIEHAASRRP